MMTTCRSERAAKAAALALLIALAVPVAGVAATIDDKFVGVWDETPAKCRTEFSDSYFAISKTKIGVHEDMCPIAKVSTKGDTTTVVAKCPFDEMNGDARTYVRTLRRVGETLQISTKLVGDADTPTRGAVVFCRKTFDRGERK